MAAKTSTQSFIATGVCHGMGIKVKPDEKSEKSWRVSAAWPRRTGAGLGARHCPYRAAPVACSSASFAFGTVSSGFTPYHARRTAPFSSMRNDERMMPMDFFPYELFSPTPVRLRRGVLRVREKREPEGKLDVELLLVLRRVRADSQGRHGKLLEFLAGVTHGAGLCGASWSVRPGENTGGPSSPENRKASRFLNPGLEGKSQGRHPPARACVP